MKALIVSVLVGGMFGSATATVDAIGDEVMVVDIEVEVAGDPATVVAHLEWEVHELVLPLVDRGEGVFGIRTELPPRNYFVVFEVIGESASRSDPVSLAEMGADLAGDRADPTTTEPDGDEGLGEESRQMLWLAVALGAASLSALAFWVLGGRDDQEELEETSEGPDRAHGEDE